MYARAHRRRHIALFLSSGAEDYFLSAYYFNEGNFKTPNSGLTYYDGNGTLSAYKTHDRDPVLWHDGIKLVFRNCETTAGCGDLEHCPNQFCPPNTTATTTAAATAENEPLAQLEARRRCWHARRRSADQRCGVILNPGLVV